MSRRDWSLNTSGDGDGDGDIKYYPGSTVLVYRLPRIYKATVQKVSILENEWNYLVHYIDWCEFSDEWVGIDRLMKNNEENFVKKQALDENLLRQIFDENLLVDGIKCLFNSESGWSTQPEVLSDVNVEKEDVKSSGILFELYLWLIHFWSVGRSYFHISKFLTVGAKGKRKEGDSSIEEVEDYPGRDMIDFISEMPDDVLVDFLGRLPLKLAVRTCVLSKRWRFVWPNLKRLDFDGSESLERAMYINQVNSVIGSHGSQDIELFRIYFNLDNTCSEDIDNWLRFAFHKKVKDLQLDFSKSSFMTEPQYDFPIPSSDGNMVHLSEWPSSGSMVVKTLSLEKLRLLHVNVNKLTLSELVKNSPHLEELSIYKSGLLTDINIGGREINLKKIILRYCDEIQRISLSDFDLERFDYVGPDVDMCLKNLPKIKEVSIGRVSVGLNNKVFSSISSVASQLEFLALNIDRRLEDLNIDAIPALPKVKTLKLTLPTQQFDCLVEFIEIARACPILETLILSLHWSLPITRIKAWRDEAWSHTIQFPHLEHLVIEGYLGGLSSDFLIAKYMIANAKCTLRKIDIDPYPEYSWESKTTGRFNAISDLPPIVPSWIHLVIH